MAASSSSLSLLLLLSLHVPSLGLIPRSRLTTSLSPSLSSSSSSTQQPQTFFEVTKPVTSSPPHCSSLILSHDFAATYGQPPVTAPYTPPHCLLRRRRPPTFAVIEWSATCRGRQFDRIFGVWLSGAEVLRSCTAEPRASGIAWTVEKDITKYSSLLSRPQTLAVFLGNVVDDTYTGIYHVNVSIHFWFSPQRQPKNPNLTPGFNSPAELILPISRNLAPGAAGGLWFEVQNSTDVQSAEIAIPINAYRAVLEVYVSFHQDDEFWYSNPPNEYIEKNNITGLAGNGAFREVTVSLDGSVVGVVWPFTVVYTGGINPLLWRPITGIGSFDLPTYDIEATPFLGKILDGEKHKIEFEVTDALDIWYVDANLHLWLDDHSSKTVGELIKYSAPKVEPSLYSKFQGLDGEFNTLAKREISATGWVNSSHGKITSRFFQKFDYKNLMVFKGNGNIQVVNQTIDFNYGTFAKRPASVVYSEQVFQNFPMFMHTQSTDSVNESYTMVSDVMLGFNVKKFSGERFGFAYSSLKNLQTGHGVMNVTGNLVTGGVGDTQQMYRYESTEGCYFRNVSSYNYTILHDESGDSCTKGSGIFSAK